MFRKPGKQELLTCALLTLWIFAVNMAGPYVTDIPLWPMYFVTIFFFGLGGEKKNIKMIFLSGITGLILTVLMLAAIYLLTPAIGDVLALAVCLFAVLALVIMGGCFFPLLLNNVTFAYFTVACLNAEYAMDNLLQLTFVLVLGGSIILGGALLCVYIARKLH